MGNLTPKQTVDPRGCLLTVIGEHESIPPRLLSTLRSAKSQQAIIIGGGVKNFSKSDVQAMVPWAKTGFYGFNGVAMSGGTAYFDKETGAIKSDIVTSIPAVLAAEYDCIAVGTFPRVEDFAIDRDWNFLYTDAYGAVVDGRYHQVVAVQKSASKVLDWDGDLQQRFAVLDLLMGWKLGYLIINGGAVTRKEAYLSLSRNIPVIVAKGSGREADALVAAVEKGDFSLTAAEERVKAGDDEKKIAAVDEIIKGCRRTLAGREHLIHVVTYGDGAGLNSKLKSMGFLSS